MPLRVPLACKTPAQRTFRDILVVLHAVAKDLREIPRQILWQIGEVRDRCRRHGGGGRPGSTTPHARCGQFPTVCAATGDRSTMYE